MSPFSTTQQLSIRSRWEERTIHETLGHGPVEELLVVNSRTGSSVPGSKWKTGSSRCLRRCCCRSVIHDFTRYPATEHTAEHLHPRPAEYVRLGRGCCRKRASSPRDA